MSETEPFLHGKRKSHHHVTRRCCYHNLHCCQVKRVTVLKEIDGTAFTSACNTSERAFSTFWLLLAT